MRIERLLAELEFDEAVERAYRAGEAAERAGRLRDAAVSYRVAADQHLGDAAVRLAGALFALGEVEEATHWCRVAAEDGFTEALALVQENSSARQRFLEHAARIVVGAPTFDWAFVGVPSVSPADVRARTQALRALDRQYGGIACHGMVLEHLAAAESGTDDAGVIAEICELAGWTTFDSGLPGVALQHFERALTLARQAEDDALISSVLSRAGRMFLHHNAPDDALKAFQLGSVVAPDIDLATMLDTYGPERVRARTLALTALARNHLATGDIAAASSFGSQAVAASAHLRSVRVDDQLRRLDQEARAAGASALAEQISARFARCG